MVSLMTGQLHLVRFIPKQVARVQSEDARPISAIMGLDLGHRDFERRMRTWKLAGRHACGRPYGAALGGARCGGAATRPAGPWALAVLQNQASDPQCGRLKETGRKKALVAAYHVYSREQSRRLSDRCSR